MKVLIALTVGLLASSLLTVRANVSAHRATSTAATFHRQGSTQSMVHSGTVVFLRQGSSNISLITRDDTGRLTRATLGARSKITTSDGRSLQSMSIRLGDRLAVRSGGQVEDLSQRTETMQALVSVAPTPDEGPMVVSIHHSQDIAVDLSASTHYQDRSHETSSALRIEDGDQVSIRGVVDRTLGEMTQTDSVSRVGPYLSRSRKHSTSTG